MTTYTSNNNNENNSYNLNVVKIPHTQTTKTWKFEIL